MSNARSTFDEFKNREGRSTTPNSTRSGPVLEPVPLDFMLGGGRALRKFVTGHKMNGLEKARWFGKTFKSVTDVQPLVCLDENWRQKFSSTQLGKVRPACGSSSAGG